MKQRMINWNRPGVGGLERGAKLSEIWTGNKDGKQLLLLLPVSLILSHLGCMASVLIEGLLASSTAESFSSFISRLFGNFTLTGVCSPHLVVVLAHFSHPGASLWPLGVGPYLASSPCFLWGRGRINYSLVCVSDTSCEEFTALVILCCYLCMELFLPPECEFLEGKDFISLNLLNLIYTAPETVWKSKYLSYI